MSLLISNASGTAANTGGTGLILPNRDPAFVENNLLTTLYFWATTWGSATIQLYLSPQLQSMPNWPVVWFPYNPLVTENGFFSFQHRWGQMKVEVTGATSSTVGLYAALFDGV